MTPPPLAGRRPTVDEWGVYDPQQAGLAALFTRLSTAPPAQAVTTSPDGTPADSVVDRLLPSALGYLHAKFSECLHIPIATVEDYADALGSQFHHFSFAFYFPPRKKPALS